ncbi:MAG: hypothetical protein WA421_01140 [Nitrososphaeraceae archaeon]
MAYNRASAYASDDVLNACKDFFALLINKENDGVKLTLGVNGIYDAILKDINPNAKGLFQV